MTGRMAGILLLAGAAGPAAAQINFGASLTSDYRLRGYSLSEGRPALSGQIGYDHASGLFVDGNASVFLSSEDKLEWMGAIGAVGYARRLSGSLAFDAGLLRAQFSPYSSLGRAAGYTELFAGLSGRSLSARLSYSPDYYRDGIQTLYGSVDAVARPGTNWRLSAHLGALTRIAGTPPFPIAATQYDWRGGVTRSFGKVDLDLSMSGGGPNRDYYDDSPRSKTALVGTVRVSF